MPNLLSLVAQSIIVMAYIRYHQWWQISASMTTLGFQCGYDFCWFRIDETVVTLIQFLLGGIIVVTWTDESIYNDHMARNINQIGFFWWKNISEMSPSPTDRGQCRWLGSKCYSSWYSRMHYILVQANRLTTGDSCLDAACRSSMLAARPHASHIGLAACIVIVYCFDVAKTTCNIYHRDNHVQIRRVMGLLPDTSNRGCACAGNAGNVFPATAG